MDLTNDPIPGLVRKIAVPASVGIFFNTMYTLVDTFFAGFISTEALAALSICFPVMFLKMALNSGISAGSSVLITNALGAKNQDKAHRICLQSISFACMVGVVVATTLYLVSPHLFQFLGAKDEYLEMAVDYMNVILCGTLFGNLQGIFNSGLSSQGDTKPFRNVLIAGFFLNCVLDPWFMFGGFGIPAMGLKGLALATIIIQFLGAVYMFGKLRRTELWKKAKFTELMPSRTYGDITRLGVPASFETGSIAALVFIATFFLSKFNTEGVAAYGIGIRIQSFIILPTFGLGIAIFSLTGQNNGANKPERIRETLNITLKYGLIIMLVGGVLLFFLAQPLMEIFSNDPKVIELGSDFNRVTAMLLFAWVIHNQMVDLLLALKKTISVIIICLYRQIIGPFVACYLLAFHFDMREGGVWWGFFLVAWSAAIVSYFYGQRVLRQRLASGQEPAESSAPVS